MQLALSTGFKNFANFKGRTSRLLFWHWVLFFWISFPIFFIFSLQRLNDMGVKRRWIALGIIPVIGLLFFCYTLIAPSKK
jgi:uncharacterized membrane protein YhaH (DUF805 family)